jgi:hypothetical protein
MIQLTWLVWVCYACMSPALQAHHNLPDSNSTNPMGHGIIEKKAILHVVLSGISYSSVLTIDSHIDYMISFSKVLLTIINGPGLSNLLLRKHTTPTYRSSFLRHILPSTKFTGWYSSLCLNWRSLTSPVPYEIPTPPRQLLMLTQEHAAGYVIYCRLGA